MKLVYRGGNIRCATNTAFNSKWGCHKGVEKQPDIPKKRLYQGLGALWCSMPGVDDLRYRELVFTNFGVPFYLERYRDLRIWCSEDLKDSGESALMFTLNTI
ncbi:hypothetical protein P5673_002711 [Acropora cervicornis]|uniref:Uncharacterized protein n=1 Tax=Acropora cervicornis TaxID=6130 RepID=A0AAD9VFW5_ACRCE|nr:hypothetical protein P5673_002711 [Acropora cervicornis]